MYEIDARTRERFLAKVTFGSGCWEWSASRTGNGYGLLRVKSDGKWVRGLAHRIAYELFIGVPPDDQVVMHICDNRVCVRPDHLRLGSQSENIRDMDAKGRRQIKGYARGMRSAHAKLTDEQVAQIKASYTGRYGEMSALGRQFGVTPQAVFAIVARQGWKHIAPSTGAVLQFAPVTRPNAQGSRHHGAKLTESEVIEIRTRYAAGGVTQYALAADYGVCVPTINNIVKRKIWTHIP